MQPERLAHSADAATGAPIVGADGLVESGNARSIAIKRVYAGPGPQAAAYKDFLQAHAAEFGLMPEQVAGMQKPVLVRVRDTPVNRAEFARQANAPTVAMMSPAEQARADAARMDLMDGLEPDESGDFSGAASRGFVRRFMARLPVSEQAAMVDADGRLSSAGYARVRNAVLAKAWGAGEGGSDALARMTESLDDNTRSISRALMMAAPETARMREAIAAGARHDADIAGDVAAAAQEISRLREAGQSVQQALAQTDAFGDKHTPEARALMQFMADNARRPRRIAQLIQAYWQTLDAAGDPHQTGYETNDEMFFNKNGNIKSYTNNNDKITNIASARKRARQAVQLNAHNSSLCSRLRTAIKKVRKAVAAGDKEAATAQFRASMSVIDSMFEKKVIFLEGNRTVVQNIY